MWLGGWLLVIGDTGPDWPRPDLYFESIGEVVPGGLQLAAQSLHGLSLDVGGAGPGLLLLQPVQHDDALPGDLLQLHPELVVIVPVPLGRSQEVGLVVLVEQPHEGGELPGGVGGPVPEGASWRHRQEVLPGGRLT